MVTRKVFGIGLNKTGTTTLGKCFELLGFKHLSCRPDLLRSYRRGDKEKVFDELEKYESFEDWPYPLMYQELYERYPDAKFVLTTRKSDEVWLRSLKNHALYGKPLGSVRRVIYGTHYPHHDDEYYKNLYRNYNAEVKEFFARNNASNQLVELCWENGSTFDDLCMFLDLPLTGRELPHENSTKNRKTSGYEILNKMCIHAKGVYRKATKDKQYANMLSNYS